MAPGPPPPWQDARQPLGTLRALPSFSGVALLLALLLSLPWLPLTPPPAPAAARAAAFYAQVPALPHVPATPPNWHYTIHVVATEAEAASLEQEFPDQVTDGRLRGAAGG